MDIKHKRNSKVGIIKHLEVSHGDKWGKMTVSQRAHEFNSHCHLLENIGFSVPQTNPFDMISTQTRKSRELVAN